MKKVILIYLLLLFCLTMAIAQEPVICGDWIGVYEGTTIHPIEDRLISADWKLYLRIKLIDGNYIVMMKRRIADESNPFIYEKKCEVQSANEKTITWTIYDEDDYDTSPIMKEQGILVGHIHETVYCTVELNRGTLTFSSNIERTNYDRQGRIINKKMMGYSPYKECTLYKENSDW